MKLLAITSLVATVSAVNGLVLPRQYSGDMSRFENQEWYEIGVTANYNQMMKDLNDQYGFTCYCTRSTFESSETQECEMTSVCDVREDSNTIGEAKVTGTLGLKSVDNEEFTADFHFGQLSFESADNGQEHLLPSIPGMDHDEELKGQVIIGENTISFVTWSEVEGQVYGSLHHSERTVDDATFDQIVSQINDHSIRDNLERYNYGCSQ
ncbi:hypothetical protein BDC45DRAFT_530406 [Circinella umbellata]|nr:hypothetical protein BDC45DRAFT_530406 [Circinella umbellata]